MPPRTPIPWHCPSCRSFSTTTSRRQLRPENPNYIAIPQPPQQTLVHKPFIKGRLPVPRDIFAGAEGKDKSDPSWLDPHTKAPSKDVQAKQGSREEWKSKISSMRRQNLREGLTSLKARRDTEAARLKSKSDRNQKARHETLTRPEREDDRLTAPSHGLDLDHLYKGFIPSSPGVRPDPTRDERIERMRANVAARTEASRAERASHLNTLYMNARSFIVTSAQLDSAVDEAFGTPENPVRFTGSLDGSAIEVSGNGASVWASGKPDRVQDMLNRANNVGGKSAFDGMNPVEEVNRKRITRIAEAFTGGKMDDGEDAKRYGV
ncbi:hypothetical protein LTR27_007202 [Elasticomyces elasticus]|nr:hypothetical protein LTR27_007202 [Elasticomyces elasticus]